MAWLVIAVGSALSAIGVAAIKFGWEIVRDERGWTQVIAGAVALSGGVVTIALGLVLARLGALRRDLVRVLREKAVLNGHDDAKKNSGSYVVKRPIAQTSGDSPRDGVKSEMKTTGPIEASFAQPLSVGGEFGGAALATAVAAPDPGDEVRPAADAREAEKEQEGRWPPQARRAVAELPSRIIAPTTLDVIAPAPAKGDDPFPSDWLERTLQGIDQRQTATRADIAPLEQPVPAATEPEPQVSAEAKAAVVGEYKAGGVAYLMYADGSIEADTPNGVYRFMSINELKSFIESQGSAGPA